jgi:hypothetical protein
MAATKVYFVFAFIYLFLGVFAVSKVTFKDKALKLFLLLTVALPITKFTTAYHTIYQVSIYYYFFIGVILVYFTKIIYTKRVSKVFLEITALLFLMLGFYLLHYLSIYQKNIVEARKLTNILKDIKPFLLIPLGIVFIDYFKERLHTILTRKYVQKLLLVNLVISALFFFFMIKFNLHLKLTDDPYYTYEELRYEALGFYLGIFYLTYLIYNNQKISIKDLLYCILPLVFTGNRTLIFSVLLIIGLYYLTKLTLKKIILFFSTLIVFFSAFIILIIRAGEFSPLFRFQKLLSLEYIQYALLNRFSPFINSLKEFSGLDYILGEGLGFTFFIPWFHYRENLDNYNIYIDNLYLTLYAKYGIFFVVFFLVTLLYLRAFNNLRTTVFYFTFVLILSITNSFFYQNNFLWIFILFAFPFNTKSTILNPKTKRFKW